MHEKWDAKRCKNFSAYAISLFQNRLVDHYKKELRSSGKGHTKLIKVDGKEKREYHYHGMVSLHGNSQQSPAHGERFLSHGAGSEQDTAFHGERSLTSWDAVE